MARRDDRDEEGLVTFAGEEDLHFIRNFHDVFLSIGLIMLLAGLYIVSEMVVGLPEGGAQGGVQGFFLLKAFVYGGLAGTCWLLAEFFARTRRLFLPSMVLFIGWCWFAFNGAALGYLTFRMDIQELGDIFKALKTLQDFPLFLSVVMSIVTSAFYLRMKLPFAMGAVGLSLSSFLFSGFIFLQDGTFGESLEAFRETFLWLWMASGLLLFVLGLYFDSLDPERRTRLSDNGFWLHFFAAPVLFSSATLLFGVRGSASGLDYSAGITLIIVAVFAFVSLLINRRALLVSGLLTAALAIGQIVRDAGLEGMWIGGATLVMLGGAMVLLGGAWHTIRGVLVAPFPKSGPIARIIPPVSRLE